MNFIKDLIRAHMWLDPFNHFLTSAVVGCAAYYIGTKVFKEKRTSIAFGIFGAIAMHILADIMWA